MRKRGLFLLLVGLGLGGLVSITRLARSNKEARLAPPNVTGLRSWQLVGQREYRGQQEPWELYYQASSLFYRERLGNDFVVMTEDATLLYCHPRDASLPIAILTRPRRIQPSLPAFLDRVGSDVDPDTGFPTRFVWHQGGQVSTDFRAAYNQPLSPETWSTTLPRGTREINLLRSYRATPLPGTVTQGAFTVKAEAEQDPVGIIHVTTTYWLGGTKVDDDFPLKVAAYLTQHGPRGLAYVPLRVSPHRWLEAVTLAPPLGAGIQGLPLRESQYLVAAKPAPAPSQFIEVPVRLEAQFRQPPASRIAANLDTHTDLLLKIPLRQRSAPFPETPYGPFDALVHEQRGQWERALEIRLRWKPQTTEQASDNKNAIAALRETVKSKGNRTFQVRTAQ